MRRWRRGGAEGTERAAHLHDQLGVLVLDRGELGLHRREHRREVAFRRGAPPALVLLVSARPDGGPLRRAEVRLAVGLELLLRDAHLGLVFVVVLVRGRAFGEHL